jgi:exopolysaccharide biosynthesis polyprenyl glycosylphosphotransferase
MAISKRVPKPRLVPVAMLGRTLAVLIPVVVVGVVVIHGSSLVWAAAMFLAAAVWLGFLNLGFAAGRTTLSTLAPHIVVFRGVLFGLVVVGVLGALVPELSFGTKGVLVLAALITVAVVSWEAVAERRFRRQTRLLLVGPASGCANVVREFARGEGESFELVGIVEDEDSGTRGLVIGSVDELGQIIGRTHPDLVALVPGCNRPRIFQQLLDASDRDFRVLELAQFYEHAFGRVPVRDLTNAWFMSVLHFYRHPYSIYVKRTTDIVAATILLILTLPLFPVLMLLVGLSPGPIFYRQIRIGQHGKLFTIYKFRSMRTDAERTGVAVWASAVDPRATRVGRIMRRTRLDELPQIFNILRGDMSFVGPRPERPEFLDDIIGRVPFWTYRHLVKPGVTGWAQVNRGYTTDVEGTLEKLSYDLWYVRHRSLFVDVVICARTLAAVMRGTHGAAAPEQTAPSVTQFRHRGITPEPELEIERV